MNSKKLGECTPTSCPKAGIKIRESDNNYNRDPFQSLNGLNRPSQLSKPVNYHNTTLDALDLDLDHYSLDDLYHLFNIEDGLLNENTLKYAKQIVLKMHPDKSHLDSKYFLFFSKAYKRLYGIYEFQNKSTKKIYKDEDFFEESNRNVLNNMFEKNKDFKDPKNFNSWFNEAFEKHRLENPIEQGYGDWLKSDEGIMNISENVSKSNMNEIFEQKKKQIQAVSIYTGVTDTFASTLGGSLLSGGDNFTTDEYTDLRQAYTETLIPVTEEDYNKIQKFNNISEYKAHRDRVDVTPLTKEEANLYHKNRRVILKHQKELKQSKIIIKKTFTVKEIINTLRKDMKHELWNKQINKWSLEDWEKFNLI
jgi:hypothetical protein